MSIILRNQLTDTNKYKVTDVALTGVSFDAARNETTLTIPSNDSRHDATGIGDYMIPMRGGNPVTQTSDFYSYDILHPEPALKVINKITGTSERKLVLQGDQRNKFPGAGGYDSPDAFNREINVSKIVRNRKYRIAHTGETTWKAFGDLYNSETESVKGSRLASVGTTFVAKASGSSNQVDADSPIFTAGAYFGSIGGTDLPYYIESTALTAGRQTTEVAGRYDKVTPYLYQREDSSIVIQKIGATDNNQTGRWTIWNQDTGQIYFEDKLNDSGIGSRFDSPALDDTTNRPGIGNIPPQARDDGFGNANSPKIEWLDRTVSVPSGLQYTSGTANAGRVIEVAHVSSMIGINRPLSNTDIDSNFVGLENSKLAADGSQPVEGNLIVNGALNASSLNVTNQILMTGVTPFSANTGLALGSKDLEVNNIRLSGTINDDALFRQYGIVAFPHSFIADYNPKYSAIEPTTILYFSNVNNIITGDTISALGNGKRGRVRRVNAEYNYVQVSELNATDKFLPGDVIVNKEGLGPILKVLNPEDYLKVGQPLRIFGINQDDTPLKNYVTSGSSFSVEIPVTPGAPTVTGRFTNGGSRSFSYKLAQFDIRTGKVSGLSSSATILNAPNLLEFDKNNYVQLTGIGRVSSFHLILVYRKANDEATHHLIDILGNEDGVLGTDTSNLTYNDYGAFNKPGWSKLNNAGYYYTADAGLVYIPINENERTSLGILGGSKTNIPYVGDQHKYSRGFLDTRVASGMLKPKLDTNASPEFFRITETAFCKGPADGTSLFESRKHDSPNIAMNWYDYAGNYSGWNSPLNNFGEKAATSEVQGASYGKTNELEIFIDNGRHVDSPNSGISGGIQKLIQDRIADGSRTARIPGGVYYSKLLTLPSDFKFEGASDRNTIIKSLPWLDDSSNNKTVYGGNVSKLYGNWATGTVAHNYDGVDKDYQAKIAMEYYPEAITGEIGTTSSLTSGISRFATLAASQVKLGSSYGIFEGVFGGNQAYARSVLEFDAKNNVEVANIRLDGNNINQSIVRMNLTGKSNYTVSGQQSSNISLKNVTIADSVLGGFYGENISEGIIEGSIIKDGGNILSTSAFATGLYLPGSSKIRLTSNSIENFSNANDLTSNQNSTLVGNIVRDTGSGILAYATSNFIHEGNLILGPADEYIPVVDTLNSEYDQLNVNLITESGAGAGDFISDTIQFLRDNSPLDLRPNDITKPNKIDQVGIALISTIRTMVGLGTQSYFLPDQTEGKTFNYSFGGIGSAGSRTIATNSSNGYVVQPNTEIEDGTINLKQGNVSFKIPQSKINELAEVAGFAALSNNYNSLNNRPTGEQLIGLVYDLSGVEYLYMDSAGDAEKILWTELVIDTTANAQTIKFVIDANYANLFSIGDKIIFTSGAPSDQIGRADNFSTSLLSSTQDANSRAMFEGLPVSQKVIVDSDTAEIFVDISGSTFAAARNNISNAEFNVQDLIPDLRNQCRLGIQNTFSITRGRIVI